MKRIALLTFAFLLSAFSLRAQERGKVEVVKDPRVDTLIARRGLLKVNSVTPSPVFSGMGYRVQIFNGPSRKDAYDAQDRIQAKYPGMRTYISYSVPNFKVKAGDFRSRLEAEKFKQEVHTMFTGLFIISEKINTSQANTNP